MELKTLVTFWTGTETIRISSKRTNTLVRDTQSPEKTHQRDEILTGKTPGKIRKLNACAKRPEDNKYKKVKMLKRQDARLVKTLNLRHGKKVKMLKR